MNAGNFHKSLLARIMSLIIIVNFIITTGPVSLYAQDMLKAPSAVQKNDSPVQNLIDDLRATQAGREIAAFKRIGILTSGGPASGHNAAIYAAVEKMKEQGIEAVAILDGFDGLYEEKLVSQARPLSLEEARSQRNKGGTMLGTDRMNPFEAKNVANGVPQAIWTNIQKLKLDGLIVLGGNDSQSTSYKLQQEHPDFPIIGLAKTMDNDLALPELDALTYGFDTFVRETTRALIKMIRDCRSMRRIGVVEVFGRSAGHVALHAGANVRASRTLLPEEGNLDLEQLVSDLRESKNNDKYRAALLVVSEGISISKDYKNNAGILEKAFAEDEVAKAAFEKAVKGAKKDSFGNPKLENTGKIIAAVLRSQGLAVSEDQVKYIARSANPSKLDIAMTELIGRAAVENLLQGNHGRILYAYNNQARSIPFASDVGGRVADLTGHKQLYLRANQAFDIKVSDKPALNFANTAEVNSAIAGILAVSDKAVSVLDEERLRSQLIDNLVYDATFGSDKEVVKLCRRLIKDTAAAQGAVLGSVYELYRAKAKDKKQYTVPAINIRGMGYNTSRAVFASAIDNNADKFIFEIARSEIGYTAQRPAELVTSVLAAAIKEGYNLPVYLQGDHFQVTLKDYTASPEKAKDYIKGLIREAIEAGFYQVDLDMSQLVDYTKADVQEQQELNYKLVAELTAYVRDLERELGLDRAGIVVNLGGEIGEIGKGLAEKDQKNSTVAELRAFMDGYNAELKRLSQEKGYELNPITKIAIQTGTQHGGIRNAKGELVRAKVSFNAIAELGKVAREEYSLAGVVQHGASTLPEDNFTLFAGNTPEGLVIDESLLNEASKNILSTNPAAEVHLATAYQDTIIDHPRMPASMVSQMREYIFSKNPVKENQNADGVFVSNRKNVWGPFKAQVWNLPAGVQEAMRDSLRGQFDVVFNNMGVKNSSQALIAQKASEKAKLVKTRLAINNPGGQERELIRLWLAGKSAGIDLVGVNGISPGSLYYLLTKDFTASPDVRAWFTANFTSLPEGIGDKNKKLILPVTEIIDAKDLPWKKLNPDVVLEGSDPQLAASHKSQGAKSVIVAHPALTAVSALMPVISVMGDQIKGINFTDIQPPTPLQRGLDNSGPDPVLMRAMGINLVPSLRKDIDKYVQALCPADLAAHIKGAINFAPQALGSLLDVHIVVNKDTDAAAINKLFKAAIEGVLKGKVSYSQDSSLVSVDTYQQPQLIFLANNTKVTGKRIVHLQFMHNEEATFAATQVPLLLQALKEGKAPSIITSKDTQTISADAQVVLDIIQAEQSKMARPAFLGTNLAFIPALDGNVKPRIVVRGKAVSPAIVGINGPGRVGRPSTWAMQGDPNVDLRMINGSSSALILSWLLSEDSVQQSISKPVTRIVITPAQLKREVSSLLGSYSIEQVNGFLTGLLSSQRLYLLKEKEEFVPYIKNLLASWGKPSNELDSAANWLLKSLVGVLDINGKKVLVVNERKAITELPWDVAGIKTIMECTGDLKNADEARQHLAHISGGKVIISAPAEGAGQSIVLGVVEPSRAAQIVDNASCTTNCLMPMVAVLNKAFGVLMQEITTVHAYTTDQTYARQATHKKEATRGRDARTNSLPGSTGAAKTAAVIYPDLAGRSDGWAVRTPHVTGSAVALTATLKGNVTKEQIQAAFKSASEKEMAGIMAYTQAPIVSSMIIGNPASSIIDGNAIEIISYDEELDQTTAGITSWYDNEYGFSNRMVNLAVALQGFSLIKGKALADIGPKTVELFENKIKEISPATVVWNGPMGVVEVAATSKGTDGVAMAITALGDKVVKVVGGGDTLKTLSEEEREKFTHVSTGGGAFLEAFQFGVDNLPGIKALIDPSTGKMATMDGLLPVLKEGDTVLIRVDFNVPLDSQLKVTDSTRIKETMVTIRPLLEKKAKVILMSHLGRPNGKFDAKLTMNPVAYELQKLLLKTKVHKLDDCVGKPVQDFIQNTVKPGEVVMLENTRFRLDEEQNASGFSKDLSQLATYYIDDAFGTAHRAHASNGGITSNYAWGKKFAGRLLEKEEQYLKQVCESPKEPMVVVLGGGKVSDKIHIINTLKQKASAFLIGGRMSLAFLAAQGQQVGDSTPDKLDVDTAKRFLADPQLKGKIILPQDNMVVTDISTGADATVVEGSVEPSDMSAFQEQFLAYLKSYVALESAEGKALAAVQKAETEARRLIGLPTAPEAAPTVTQAAVDPAQLRFGEANGFLTPESQARNKPDFQYTMGFGDAANSYRPASDLSPALLVPEGTVYTGTSVLFGNFANAVKNRDIAERDGAVVIGANVILENAGSLTSLKAFKDTGKIVVYAQDTSTLEVLKAMGIDSVTKNIINGETKGVSIENIAIEYSMSGETVLVTAPVDRKDINLGNIQKAGVRMLNLETPKTEVGKINSMPLVIARAFARIYQEDANVPRQFNTLSNNYATKNQVLATDIEKLNNLASQICDVPLVQLNMEQDKEIIAAQMAYQAAVSI